MQTRSIIVVVLGLALLGAALCGSYCLGARAADASHAAALAAVESERANDQHNADRSMEQLRFSLVESQGRIDGIANGLGSAIDLASRTADRGRRITILVAGIDEALRGIRGDAHD